MKKALQIEKDSCQTFFNENVIELILKKYL